jgi:peptide deformylase
MTVLPILRWPEAILREVCAPVGAEDMSRLAANMLETMYAAPGRGLAAPQVGVARALFVMDVTWKESAPAPQVFLDPEILWSSPTLVTGPEGCLSIPGVTVMVRRAEAVRVAWRDLTGALHEEVLTGFAAICAQHEIDHLRGIVTLNHLAPEARAVAEAAIT